MANIKNLQMWNTICNDLRIGISKSFLGMKTNVTFKKNGSKIHAKTLEYSPSDGERLKTIISSPKEQIPESVGQYRPKPIVNGNYMMEICMSEDNEFIVLQLFQYNRLNYEPVSDILFFEGTDAKTIGKLFM